MYAYLIILLYHLFAVSKIVMTRFWRSTNLPELGISTCRFIAKAVLAPAISPDSRQT